MTVSLIGASRQSYLYNENQIPVPSWSDVAGGYAFAYRNVHGLWIIIYVGETGSYQQRLTNHERWPEAVRLGATHILTRLNPYGETARQAEERDLIASYDPPLNTQLRPQMEGPLAALLSGWKK
jgi:hypothetical protein